VESLLSAKVADRQTEKEPWKKPHDSNLELFGQGIANLGSGLFAGMPVTGVVVRSTVNIQSGGRTRRSAMAHGVILLMAILYMGGVIKNIPIAALAGLLCLIGFRLLEFHLLIESFRKHRVEFFAFILAAGGTLMDHLVLGLSSSIALMAIYHWVQRPKVQARKRREDLAKTGIRAQIAQTKNSGAFTPPQKYTPSQLGNQWVSHLAQDARIPSSAYVHPNASVIGRVILGRDVHVAAEASVRADEGTPFYIGDRTNIQDGVVLHALKEKHVQVNDEKWAIYIGSDVSVAHQALVHGPSFVGDRTFIGFKAVVHDSVVGEGCFIGMGAIVVGVEIPAGKFVPHGMVIDSQDKVQGLPNANSGQQHFNEDVVEVNRGLAKAYRHVEESPSTGATASMSPHPKTFRGGCGCLPDYPVTSSVGIRSVRTVNLTKQPRI
jgi:sulfate permease, SulP family